MTPLPLSSQTLAWLNHAADAGQRDAQALLNLIARADAQDQWFAEFTDHYSKTIAALCRRLADLERGANDLTAAPDPVEPEIEVCETCDGEGTIDERLGGISTSNPAATCPDCDGVGEPRRFHRQLPAAPVDAGPVANALILADALTKAEAVLTRVGDEGFDMHDIDEAATVLAAIRPVMRQHGIRTSEWPAAAPAPATPTPPPTAPVGGLVERVASAMGPSTQAAMDAGELPIGSAFFASREVADWLCGQGQQHSASIIRREICR